MSTSSFLIFLNSDNKSYGSNTSFAVSLNDFDIDQDRSVAISLHSLSMFNVQYPVNSLNNSIQYQEAGDTGTTYTATLTPGSYTGSEIATEIATQMTANTGNAYTYACTYNDNNGKLTISETLPDNFKITSISSTLLGFEAGTAFASTATGDYPVNLSGVGYLDIMLPSFLTQNMATNSNSYGLISRVNVNVPWGSLITYKSEIDDNSIIINSTYLNNLTVEIRNPDGTLYNLPSNFEVSLVLKCNVLG